MPAYCLLQYKHNSDLSATLVYTYTTVQAVHGYAPDEHFFHANLGVK